MVSFILIFCVSSGPLFGSPSTLSAKPTQVVTGFTSFSNWKQRKSTLKETFQVELLSSNWGSMWFCGKICQGELWKWLSVASGKWLVLCSELCEGCSTFYPSVSDLLWSLEKVPHFLTQQYHKLFIKNYCYTWNKTTMCCYYKLQFSDEKLFWRKLIYLISTRL